MYFTTYTYNGLSQGFLLLRDLKLAQQNKLSPWCTFTSQIIGCVIGALLNYVMMITYVSTRSDFMLFPLWSNVCG